MTNVAGQTVTGTVDDPSITTATLLVNGTSRTISIAPDGSFNETVMLIAGANTIEVRASDSATPPNTGTSGVINVTVDTTAPVMTIGLSDPTDSITIMVSSDEALNAPPTANVRYTAPIGALGAPLPIVMTRVGVNQWVYTHGSESSPLVAGDYVITVTGTDRAGNATTRSDSFSKETIDVDGENATTVQDSNTTLEIETNGAVSNADVSVTQHLENPSGNVGNPSGADVSAGAFVEINASAELRDNLKQIYIRVDYLESELPPGTDESTLRLYLWDVTEGIWKLVPDSGVNTEENYIYGYVDHLSKYGVFGSQTVTPPAGGGGGGAIPAPVTVTGFLSTDLTVNPSTGVTQQDAEIKTVNGDLTLNIAQGTKLLDAKGMPNVSLSANKVTSPPAAPSGNAVVLTYDLGPNGTTFDPAIALTLKYDPKTLPAGVTEGSLVITWWDGAKWQTLPTKVDEVNNTVTAYVSHFTNYAVMGKLPPAVAPASFTIASVSVSPAVAKPSEAVTVSTVVTNTGGTQGTYNLILKIDGVWADSKDVTLAAGVSQTVTFTVTKANAATYNVDVNGKTVGFVVEVPKPTTTTTTTTTQVPTSTTTTTTTTTQVPTSTTSTTTTTTPVVEPNKPVNWGLLVGILIVAVIAAAVSIFVVRGRKKHA